MRVLHVNAGYWPWIGGAQTYTQAMSERFAHDGDAVRVVTSAATRLDCMWLPHAPQLPPGDASHNGVSVHRCRVGHPPFAPWSFYAIRRAAPALSALPFGAEALLNALAPWMPRMPDIERALSAGETPDVVHAINISLEWPLVAAARHARRARIPLVTTPFVHVGPPEVQRNYLMRHQVAVLRQSDAVIVQTGLERDAVAAAGVDPGRIEIVGMGVDLDGQPGDAERFRRAHDLGPATRVVTFMGTLTRDKGTMHVCEAARALRDRDVVVALAGDAVVPGGFDQYYTALSEADRRRILRLGSVSGADKADLLEATDVFAMPSRVDSFGIVYLEAWARGKPVIGARAGGVPDVIRDGEDGLLVAFGDVSGLAAAITRLLDDRAYGRALGAAGRAKVERRYTWDAIYARLRAVYARLLS